MIAKLAHSAAKQGRNPDELVQDVLTRYFDEEARFVEAVSTLPMSRSASVSQRFLSACM
jgi:hypothetical protein